MPANIAAAEKAASELLETLGINKIEEIDPKLIAGCCDLTVEQGPIDGLEGLLYRYGGKGLIICNSLTRNEGRTRFTIAHEIGHWLLHPNQGQDFLLTEDAIARHKQDPIEDEANAFAGSLLMPRQWFGAGLAQKPILVSTMVELANKFNVSVIAATKRVMDLTTTPSVAIFSNGEEIRWYWPSPGTKIFLKPRTEIDVDCTAYGCQDSIEDATRVGPTPNTGEFWFPDDFNKHEMSIEEQSCRIYQELVLTLIKFV